MRRPHVPAEFDRHDPLEEEAPPTEKAASHASPSALLQASGREPLTADEAASEPLAIAASRVAKKVQVVFFGPEGAKVRWDVRRRGAFDSEPFVCPVRHNFPQGAIYALKFEAIPERPQLTLYPTLEIAPASEKTAEYLVHNGVPVGLTDEEIEQLVKGASVTKVVYLPDPEFQELALAGVETLVSTRLEPGTDPIIEADRRGTILAILQADGKFVAPAYQRRHEPAEPSESEAPEPGRILLPGVPFPGVPMGLPPLPQCPAPDAESHRAPNRPGKLIYTSDELRRLLDEWERQWLLDRPDHRTPFRTQGGCL